MFHMITVEEFQTKKPSCILPHIVSSFENLPAIAALSLHYLLWKVNLYFRSDAATKVIFYKE